MVEDVTEEYRSRNTNTITDINQFQVPYLVERDCIFEHVAAAAASTLYLNVSGAGVVSLDAAAVAMPQNYMLVITAYAQTTGAAPDNNDVYMHDGTNNVYFTNGTDQFAAEPICRIVQGPEMNYHLTFYGSLAATTTYDIYVAYELYLLEGRVLKTTEINPT